jgi:uridine phosphorylase
MIVKLTWFFLILFFGNVKSLKIFYVKHLYKQNSELMNISFSIENTKSGMLVNYSMEQKRIFEFLWVVGYHTIFIQFK